MGSRWHNFQFPFKKGATGWFEEAADADVINSSIKFILGFCNNDYVCLPGFSADLCSVLFEPNDFTLRSVASHQIAQALAKWEPRIKVTQIDIKSDENQINLTIGYELVSEPGAIRFYNDTITRPS